MKTVVNNEKTKEHLGYPFLGIRLETNCIVLFTGESEGICLSPGISTTSEKGGYSTRWSMELFEPFEGSIKLSNN